MKTKKLPLPEPSPSTPFLVLHLNEVGDSYLEYETSRSEQRARIVFERLIGARMDGYCCEAERADLSIGEIRDSEWLAACVAQQKTLYPHWPNTLDGIRHFFIKGHDTSVEVLAEGFRLDIIAGRDRG